MSIFNHTVWPQSSTLIIDQSSRKISRWKASARIRTIDGQTLCGEVYFRPTVARIWDALNNEDEDFIAVTGVADEKGLHSDRTYLVNFEKIVCLSFSTSLAEARIERADPAMSISYRKVPAVVKTADGVVYHGKLSVRQTLSRVKDELNVRDGRFIPLEEVVAKNGQVLPEVFFVNKQHIVFTAVANHGDSGSPLTERKLSAN